MFKLKRFQSNRLVNACHDCSHKDLCRVIEARQKDLEASIVLIEDQVVLFHTISLQLNEKGFQYPNSYSFCYYSSRDRIG